MGRAVLLLALGLALCAVQAKPAHVDTSRLAKETTPEQQVEAAAQKQQDENDMEALKVSAHNDGMDPSQNWIFKKYKDLKHQYRMLLKEKESKEEAGDNTLGEHIQKLSDTLQVLKTPVAWSEAQYYPAVIPQHLSVRWFHDEITMCSPESGQIHGEKCDKILNSFGPIAALKTKPKGSLEEGGAPTKKVKKSKKGNNKGGEIETAVVPGKEQQQAGVDDGANRDLEEAPPPDEGQGMLSQFGDCLPPAKTTKKILYVGDYKGDGLSLLCLSDIDRDSINAQFMTSEMVKPAMFTFNSLQLTLPDGGKSFNAFLKDADDKYQAQIAEAAKSEKSKPQNGITLATFVKEWRAALEEMPDTEYMAVAKGGSGAKASPASSDKSKKGNELEEIPAGSTKLLKKAIDDRVLFTVLQAAAEDGKVSYEEPLKYLPIYRGDKQSRPQAGYLAFDQAPKTNQNFENALLLVNPHTKLGIRAMPGGDSTENDELEGVEDDGQ